MAAYFRRDTPVVQHNAVVPACVCIVFQFLKNLFEGTRKIVHPVHWLNGAVDYHRISALLLQYDFRKSFCFLPCFFEVIAQRSPGIADRFSADRIGRMNMT